MEAQLTIRMLSVDDLPLVLLWRNDPDVRKYMFTQHEISYDEHLQWFYKASTDISRKLLIVEESKNPIGYVQFNHVSVGGIADWGFYARPGAPKGSGLKLGVASLNYAFNELGLHKVMGEAIHSNEISISFHKKLGFVQEGILREHKKIGNEYYHLYCFGLLSHEWCSLGVSRSE